jgi:hypothetical protein
VLTKLPNADPHLRSLAVDAMWNRVNLLQRNGAPVYGGLVDKSAGPLILPSEARSLAEVTLAAAAATPTDSRLPIIRAGLLGMADGQGWGSTNATSFALQALAASWQAPDTAIPLTVTLPGTAAGRAALDASHPLYQASTTQAGAIRVQAKPGVAALMSADYVPAEPGAKALADQHGFVMSRTLFRVPPMQGATQPPMSRIEPAADGLLHLKIGDVVEEVDELVNPELRAQVALQMPLAAGMEPLNPALATATAEATPSAGPTLAPSWASYGDDEVTAVYLSLPAGTTTLRTRLRATIAGSYTLPPASAAMLYQQEISGSTAGARLVIER